MRFGRYKFLGGLEAAEVLGGLEALRVSWGLKGLRGDPEGTESLEVRKFKKVHRLFLANCYQLHVPSLPCQPARNVGGLVIHWTGAIILLWTRNLSVPLFSMLLLLKIKAKIWALVIAQARRNSFKSSWGEKRELSSKIVCQNSWFLCIRIIYVKHKGTKLFQCTF